MRQLQDGSAPGSGGVRPARPSQVTKLPPVGKPTRASTLRLVAESEKLGMGWLLLKVCA